MGHRHDLPGGLRRRRPAHARAAHPVRRAGRRGAGRAGRSGVGDPRDRPQGDRAAARRPGLDAVRRAAGRLADPLDRLRPGRRRLPRGAQGLRRDQQGARADRGGPDPVRLAVRADRRHALALAGPHPQAHPGRAAGRGRADHRRGQRVGAGGAEHQGGHGHRPDPDRRDRHPADPRRPAAQAQHGSRVPLGVHRRRPAAVGCGRARASHADDRHRQPLSRDAGAAARAGTRPRTGPRTRLPFSFGKRRVFGRCRSGNGARAAKARRFPNESTPGGAVSRTKALLGAPFPERK
ncbi:hypothetical protein MICRO11B_230197 [Micrococcus luteus]|nr:hypothetical protein MICRO11B_230197 [Micrococcus luteus]